MTLSTEQLASLPPGFAEAFQAKAAAFDRAARVHTSEWVDDIIAYHAPDSEQLDKIATLRAAAAHYIKSIIECCPDSCDRDKAIESARQALMFANASVVLAGAI